MSQATSSIRMRTTLHTPADPNSQQYSPFQRVITYPDMVALCVCAFFFCFSLSSVCVCVSVCEKERERDRERFKSHNQLNNSKHTVIIHQKAVCDSVTHFHTCVCPTLRLMPEAQWLENSSTHWPCPVLIPSRGGLRTLLVLYDGSAP